MATIARLSRFRLCFLISRSDGAQFLSDREPFGYQDRADNFAIRARLGDTWWTLAAQIYEAEEVIDRPEILWWVVADYQPSPVVDPTLRIEPGRIVYAPSVEVLLTRVFSEDRRVLHR